MALRDIDVNVRTDIMIVIQNRSGWRLTRKATRIQSCRVGGTAVCAMSACVRSATLRVGAALSFGAPKEAWIWEKTQQSAHHRRTNIQEQ
jgi:hypothetical protein